MKKPTVTAYLNMQNNRHIVNVDGQKGITFPAVLIKYLKQGIYSETMKACTPISKDGYKNYKFKVYNDEGRLNNYFVVRVSHKQRYLHKDTIQKIEEISGIYGLITKVNFSRFLAGLTATALILGTAGPTIAKGLINIADKGRTSNKPSYSNSTVVTHEQKEQSLKEYYEDLKKRAEAGDAEAIDEYSIYSITQQLEEQKEENSNHFRK